MSACGPRTPNRAVLAVAIVASAVAVVIPPVARSVAQVAATTKTIANERYRYAVALPAGCRLQEGPGTVDAVCAKDFDPERSALASSATALVMEVGAEVVADDAGRTAGELAQRYDVPLNTMRTWLRRSLMKLKDCLRR